MATRRQIVRTEGAAARRRIRRPEFPFQIRQKPWVIQPFFIAPVIPGETMVNALMQSRAVSSPVKSRLLGAHMEHYLFYVPLRALPNFPTFVDKLIKFEDMTAADVQIGSLGSLTTSLYYSTQTICGEAGTESINWLAACLEQVVAEYFRAPGPEQAETPFVEPTALGIGPEIDNMPIASIKADNWLDSAELEANLPDAYDLDVDLNADSTIMMSEIKQAERQWLLMQEMGFTGDQTYEEFLAVLGQRVAPAEMHRCELLRRDRSWTYPVNHVDPTSGTPTSAWVWTTGMRADKKRFFKEHGFVIGVCVVRPKVYLGKVRQSAVGLLKNSRDWLPAILSDDPGSSIRKLTDPSFLLSDTSFVADNDPTPCESSVPIVVDLADLYRYGEQFINFALTETNAGLVALPAKNTLGATDRINRQYVSSTDLNGLFVGSTDATRVIEQDGVISLAIQGLVVDPTVSTPSFSADD